MNGYIIKKTKAKKLDVHSSEWDRAAVVEIDKINWKEYEADIRTEARVLAGDSGLFVRFSSDEHPVSVNIREHNGDVYKDSAAEFFFAPDENDDKYMNFEINAEGYLLAGIGPGRDRIRIYDTDFSQFDIQSEITGDGFKVCFFIPFAFIGKYFKNISKKMKGNFQKCRETPPLVHFNSAFAIKTPEPDFHRPEFFGDIILEQE